MFCLLFNEKKKHWYDLKTGLLTARSEGETSDSESEGRDESGGE
jgi:hypothetical protein